MKESLSERVALWRRRTPRVLVVGDVMLDVYVEGMKENVRTVGDSRRYVSHVTAMKSRFAPGGAANAAMAAKLLIPSNVRVELCGRFGDDQAGEFLETMLEHAGVDTFGLNGGRGTGTTTQKFHHYYQNGRIQWNVGDDEPMPSAEYFELEVLQKLDDSLADVVLLSDYGKGMVSNVPHTRLPYGMLIHDAKYDIEKHVMTPRPNLRVMIANLDALILNKSCFSLRIKDELEQLQDCIDRTINNVSFLVTCSNQGAVLHRKGLPPLPIPVNPREHCDPLGAGDATSAALTVALANGMDLEDACRVACAAGACAVDGVGCTPPTLDQLVKELEKPEYVI